MSTSAMPREGAASEQVEQRGFGITTATALVVGSIIGVGSSTCRLARVLRPDHARGDGAHDRRRARARPAVRIAVPSAARLRRALRVRPRGLREHARLRQRLVVLDHGVGGQRRHRRRLGALRRGVRQHRHKRGSRSSSCSSASGSRRRSTSAASGTWAPSRSDHDPQVRGAAVHGDRRPLLHRHGQLHAVERQRRQRDQRDRRRHGDRPVQLPRRRDRSVAAGKVRDPDRNMPRSTVSARWRRPSSTCCR